MRVPSDVKVVRQLRQMFVLNQVTDLNIGSCY